MHKIVKLSLITLALSALAVVGAHADPVLTPVWTYENGFWVGCDIGNTEPGEGAHESILNATLQLAIDLDEMDYHDGVQDGYNVCKFRPGDEEDDETGGGTGGGGGCFGVSGDFSCLPTDDDVPID